MRCPFQGALQVNTWRELTCHVQNMENWLSAQPGGPRQTAGAHIVFRGQAKSEWRLETTLERRGRIGQIRCADYLKLAESVRNQVSGFGTSFSMPDLFDVDEKLRKPGSVFWALGKPIERILEYWIYLRHHSFPSPLLDWTSSLETAAYFAFKAACAPKVAIYAFCETPEE